LNDLLKGVNVSPDYGLSIAEAFKKYLKTGKNELIERYSAKELKIAISHLSPFYDNNKQWYRQLERRIAELENIREHHRQLKSNSQHIFLRKWLDKIIAFGIGLFVGFMF